MKFLIPLTPFSSFNYPHLSNWGCIKSLICFPHRVHRASLRAHCGSHMLTPVVLNHDGHKGRRKGLKGNFETAPSQRDEGSLGIRKIEAQRSNPRSKTSSKGRFYCS